MVWNPDWVGIALLMSLTAFGISVITVIYVIDCNVILKELQKKILKRK